MFFSITARNSMHHVTEKQQKVATCTTRFSRTDLYWPWSCVMSISLACASFSKICQKIKHNSNVDSNSNTTVITLQQADHWPSLVDKIVKQQYRTTKENINTQLKSTQMSVIALWDIHLPPDLYLVYVTAYVTNQQAGNKAACYCWK